MTLDGSNARTTPGERPDEPSAGPLLSLRALVILAMAGAIALCGGGVAACTVWLLLPQPVGPGGLMLVASTGGLATVLTWLGTVERLHGLVSRRV